MLHGTQILFHTIIFMSLVTLIYLYTRSKEYQMNRFKLRPTGKLFNKTIRHQDTLNVHEKSVIMKLHTAKVTAYSKEYKVVPNILYPSEGPANTSLTDVTLCVQSSSNHLDNLQDLSQQWQGPISASIFASGREILPALRKMAYIHKCVSSVGRYVQFHLVFPVSDQPSAKEFNSTEEFNCNASLITNYLKPNVSVINYKQSVAYPVNFLRTVSLTRAISPFVFTLDMDLIPSINLHEEFQVFLKKIIHESIININTTAFVIPSFESNKISILNFTKSMLLHEWKKHHFRPFHTKPCRKCQSPTDYGRWHKLPQRNQLEVAYIKGWVDKWEPFYIAKKDGLPLFDVRFKQYGKNRVSQVCEMHVAGYQFAVMNNAFVIHKGLKKKHDKYQDKYHDQKVNKAHYVKFKSELTQRYPLSQRKC